MVATTNLFINGQSVPASDNATFEVKNTATGKVVGLAAAATSEDCKAAADAAGKALKFWENTSLEQRRDIFLKLAEVFKTEQFKTQILQAMEEEVSIPSSWGYAFSAGASDYLRSIATMVSDLRGTTFNSSTSPGTEITVRRKAVGVILAIVPWNNPLSLTLRAICIPILCGNTVVLKAAELSPRSISIVADAFREAGLPHGVLNFISMSAQSTPTLIPELIGHPAIRKINFTGSDRVGRIIAIEAAKHLKPCVLELGGKAPAIVLDDADLVEAAKAIVSGAMLFSGQICMSTERVIVQKEVADPFISNVSKLCETLKAGPDSSASLGPLFSEGSAETVLNMIQEAHKQGAEVLVGDLQRQGLVIQPHVLTRVTPEMAIWKDESFGPVFVVAVVDTIEEALGLANKTDYSLSSSLWTNNVHAARKIAPLIHAGYVNINGSTIHVEPYLGLVGLTGRSGYGRFDIDEFTIKQLINNHPPGKKYPLFN